MNVLIVGSGAREHALAWKLRRSPLLGDLFVAPGNAGTASIAHNLPIPELDFEALHEAVRTPGVELVVVGPEVPLAAGIVDYREAQGVLAYGPTRAAAEIESSKVWAKQLMLRHGVPTAPAEIFDDVDAARRFVQASARVPVVKADGLAAGKGVVVASTPAEALEALTRALVDGAFGAAGRRVLLQERLEGREVSTHVFSDGARIIPVVLACDYKRAFDDDLGPNTGGMGAYSPPGFVDARATRVIMDSVSLATMRAMQAEGRPYRGTLYPGLITTAEGPKVIEFNCRFGDPETQVILARLKSDLLPILVAAASGDLSNVEVTRDERPCVGVVMTSRGYPGAYETGEIIAGLDTIDTDVQVFHAGTARWAKPPQRAAKS